MTSQGKHNTTDSAGRPFARAFNLSLLRQAICLLSLVSFGCLAAQISNTTPLAILAGFGLLSFFLPEGNRPSLFTWLFAAFFLYHSLTDYFLFPETSGFTMYRRMLYAFFAGIAVFYALKKPYADFTLQQNLATIIVLAVSLPVIILSGDSETLWTSDRLSLLWIHPNVLGMWCAVMIISGVSIMLFKWPKQNTDTEQRDCFICRVHVNRLFVLFSVIAAIPVLWLTDSRSSFFFSLLVCGAMLLGYFYHSRWRKPLLVLSAAVIGLTLITAVTMPAQIKNKLSGNRHFALILAGPWNDPTFISRTPLWESGLYAFKLSPLLGNGPESFPRTHNAFLEKNYDRLIANYDKPMVDNDTVGSVHTHNMYLLQLAESGIIGFVLLLALLIAPLVSALRNRTLYGTAVPILCYMILLGFFECPFYGNFTPAFNITVTFMTLGYFSALKGS